MRRDLNLIRTLLLKLEEIDLMAGDFTILEPPFEELGLEETSVDEVWHHLACLQQSGLIVAEHYTARDGFTFHRLSWEGCDFLDAVRDPEVWKRAKAGATKMGGWTLGLLKDLGTAYQAGCEGAPRARSLMTRRPVIPTLRDDDPLLL